MLFDIKKLQKNKFNVTVWRKKRKKIPGIETFFGKNSFKSFLKKINVIVNVLPLTEENRFILNKDKNHGNISIYAQDEDYHSVIKNKLQTLQDWFKDKYNLETKIFVDTSPIMEKYFAEKAGLGWQGKHTNIVSKSFGSWLFLAEIFLPIKINETKNMINGCGSCVKCLEICPTNAILSNYKIDSKRCISYLTIENKGPIPISLRKLIGNKIYGCDDCLSICPWNKFATETHEKKLISNDKNDLLFFRTICI